MSLINQALRKAQRDRNPSQIGAAGDAAQPVSDAYAPPSSGTKPVLIISLIVGIALLVGLVAGLSVVLLQKSNPAPAQTATPPPPAHAITSPGATSASQPGPLQPQAVTASDAQGAPTLTTAGPDLLQELRVAREAAEAKAAAEAQAAREAEAAAAQRAAAEPNPDIIQWLAEARVTGVRLSEAGNKVLINNRAYGVGEVVHYGFGLKVLIIQEHRILFVDGNDQRYMKRL